ncbi:hypothetical protein DPMN_164422 [Dreissena polymorpha]|uniref:Transmembrane protein n=1 Tax=Dreissena polymorpha TaxID=45954 RepID=A0A9D4EV30_DREPO|nr:hypothetical protein DPMN_164422 [Dreissena polymorpha]
MTGGGIMLGVGGGYNRGVYNVGGIMWVCGGWVVGGNGGRGRGDNMFKKKIGGWRGMMFKKIILGVGAWWGIVCVETILSYDNHQVDGRTDRPTDMSKAIYPLFFEGRHNKGNHVCLHIFSNDNLFRCFNFASKLNANNLKT